MSTFALDDIFSPDRWRLERNSDAASLLVNSPGVKAPAWKGNVVEAELCACARILPLPASLMVRWRAGGPGSATGATCQHADGTLAIYLDANRQAFDLKRTTRHEAFHCSCLFTGRSRRVSIAIEENEADAFSRTGALPEDMQA